MKSNESQQRSSLTYQIIGAAIEIHLKGSSEMKASGIAAAFGSLEKPRREQGQLHKLIDICTVVSGDETCGDIIDFGRGKEAGLGEFLDLPHGIPSHDTFARVFQLLDPKQLQRCYRGWIDSIRPVLADRDIVPIDGKTLRGSQDRSSGKRALHLLHARSVEAGLVFGHRGMDEK